MSVVSGSLGHSRRDSGATTSRGSAIARALKQTVQKAAARECRGRVRRDPSRRLTGDTQLPAITSWPPHWIPAPKLTFGDTHLGVLPRSEARSSMAEELEYGKMEIAAKRLGFMQWIEMPIEAKLLSVGVQEKTSASRLLRGKPK
jgi:hypothetical protein